MKRVVLCIAIAACLLAGCSHSEVETSGAISKVHIRNGGSTVTSYDLDANSRIIRSTSLGQFNVAVTRDYSYDDRGELMSVQTTRPYQTSSITNTYEFDSLGRKSSSRRQRSAGRESGATEYVIEYSYDADGQVNAIVQTDSRGNVLVRNTLDEEE